MEYKEFRNTGLTSDKITHHGYHRIYPWILGHLKDKKDVNLLEIGAHEMGSVKLWKQYFSSVDITIIDIDQKSMDGVKCVKLDQSNREALEIFASENHSCFDVIVDDGSHVPEHQFTSVVSLWSTLKPRGIYIIEDIETSYWGNSEIYGYRFNSNKFSIVNEVKRGVDLLNIEFQFRKNRKNSLLDDIILDSESIMFAYNCIILIKKSGEFEHFYNREYRFAHKIDEFSRKNKIYRLLNKFLTILK
jgi:hypothetical protein